MQKLTATVVSTVLAGGMVLTLAPSSHAATSIRGGALRVAAKQENDPYKEGAEGPSKFDCSGLVHFAYLKAGYKWPSRLDAQGQYNRSKKISKSNRKPGDLVFFGPSGSNIKHVGIYAGKGEIWNANTGPYRGKRVVLAPISEYTGKVFYRRLSN